MDSPAKTTAEDPDKTRRRDIQLDGHGPRVSAPCRRIPRAAHNANR